MPHDTLVKRIIEKGYLMTSVSDSSGNFNMSNCLIARLISDSFYDEEGQILEGIYNFSPLPFRHNSFKQPYMTISNIHFTYN
jgi:hypothetical protein